MDSCEDSSIFSKYDVCAVHWWGQESVQYTGGYPEYTGSAQYIGVVIMIVGGYPETEYTLKHGFIPDSSYLLAKIIAVIKTRHFSNVP